MYSSGISQLREAMMRLVADGLIVLENNKGFTVAPVSREELADIVRLRSELETMAIGMAIEKGDLRWEANIMARYHEVSRLPIFNANGLLSEEWDAANAAFHQALYAACGSPLLMSFCDFLRERYYRYRRLWAKYGNPPEDTEKDHKNLLNAVIARDMASVVPLVRSHFERTANSILEHWSAGEDGPDTA
jgi:GntR family carbon starvation induced transcriptional regulator